MNLLETNNFMQNQIYKIKLLNSSSQQRLTIVDVAHLVSANARLCFLISSK